MWDAVGTVAIGVLLVMIAVLVAIEVKGMLVGQSVDPALERRLRAFFEARPEIERVLHLIPMQLGSDVLVSVPARMVEPAAAQALLRDITRGERALKQAFPRARWSLFEPGAAATPKAAPV